VASVCLRSPHTAGTLLRGLNACLPPDVRVIDVEETAEGFHARFSARSKTYRYLVRNAPIVSPFERLYVWHLSEPLDVPAMQTAANMIVGTHDFSSFRSTGSSTGGAVRTITRSVVHRVVGGPVPAIPAGGEPTLVAYEIAGSGFLRHMVRAIVGTLVEIGRGRRTASSMAALLTGASRAEAGATAPPHGLFLVRVDYD
jgi:tRNA pseudouridine38-40 synthase